MRVVIYIRVSTTEQAEEGYSIRAQRAQLIDYCRVNDYEVVDIYIDDGYSAKDLNRPRLKDLLKHAEKGLFDAEWFISSIGLRALYVTYTTY